MKKTKKILVTSPFFYPHMGGSELYMEELYVNLLQKHPELNVDVLCYNTDHKAPEENHKGLKIYRIPCINILPGKYSLPNPIALWKFFYARRDYDLIHCSTRFFDLSWWSLIGAKLGGKKVILTDHLAGIPSHPNIIIRYVARFVDTLSGNLSLKFYDKVFAVSSATKTFLEQNFAVKSKLVYAGVNSVFLNGVKKAKTEKIRAVYAGRMITVKGVLLLVDIASRIDWIDFYFAGPGELSKFIRKRALQKKLSNIHVSGPMSQEKLADLFKRSEIFVYPSYHPEGIPMALLQAGASNLAVIAANTGGVKEVILNNQTGLLIKPKDKESLKRSLERLGRNKALRNRLSRNLSVYIRQKFNWKNNSKAFYSEIEEFLE